MIAGSDDLTAFSLLARVRFLSRQFKVDKNHQENALH
jgi:hypothetical protein